MIKKLSEKIAKDFSDFYILASIKSS